MRHCRVSCTRVYYRRAGRLRSIFTRLACGPSDCVIQVCREVSGDGVLRLKQAAALVADRGYDSDDILALAAEGGCAIQIPSAAQSRRTHSVPLKLHRTQKLVI